MIASIAPAAPKVWPIIDLVDETASSYAWSPKTSLIAFVSAMSPSGVRGAVGVDVADALRLDPRPLERRRHHRGDTGRLGLRLGHVVRVVRRAVAEHLCVDPRAAPFCRLPVLDQDGPGALGHHEARAGRIERTRSAGRVLVLGGEPAHGGEARRGSAGSMHASVPPASTASASPRLIISAASPIACEPVAHAETTA